ncbi:MAG: hypothetical protein HQM14_19850 [SAR324 cluster bacterium]|nr:hypothetical protein [SAR324 cluster bacterium]
MIGLDRPLRPNWIYETLKMIEVGENPSNYNIPFESIAKELVGKEGKRKVRTVIFRSFIYTMQEKRTKIEHNLFLDLCEKLTLNEIKPLLLIKILIDYDATRFVTQKIRLLLDHSRSLNTESLTKKIVTEYGDRDVVKRSMRSFLKTLEFFEICEVQDKKTLKLHPFPTLDNQQLRLALIIYAECYLKSRVIDLIELDEDIFFFCGTPQFDEVGREFNGADWEFVLDGTRRMLLLK